MNKNNPKKSKPIPAPPSAMGNCGLYFGLLVTGIFSMLVLYLYVSYHIPAITILGLAVLFLSIMLFIGWLANQPKPYKDPPMNVTVTEKEWDEYVKLYPNAWQYCQTCGDRIVHVFNKVTRRWECLGCMIRGAR
jgi:hypothetical protein